MNATPSHKRCSKGILRFPFHTSAKKKLYSTEKQELMMVFLSEVGHVSNMMKDTILGSILNHMVGTVNLTKKTITSLLKGW